MIFLLICNGRLKRKPKQKINGNGKDVECNKQEYKGIKLKEQYWFTEGRKVTYWQAVRNLIGHLIGTAALFIAFLTLGWGISFAAHWLNTIHPMPENILQIVNYFELSITWIDAGVCTILVIFGASSFIRDLRRM
jgi:hypothetical protein